MNKIKSFKCGLCKEHERVKMDRKNFRKHLAEKHSIYHNKFNFRNDKNKTVKQTWVKDESL